MEMPDIDQYQYTSDLDEKEDYNTEPAGYEEVELDNGDIVMKPYWPIRDDQDDNDT